MVVISAGCSKEGEDEPAKASPPAPAIEVTEADAGTDKTDATKSVKDNIPAPDTTDMERRVVSAITDARHGVVRQPDSAESWGRYGEVLQAHFLFAEAGEAYAMAAALLPDSFRWRYLLATAMIESNVEKEAILSTLEAAIRIDPSYLPAHMRLGDLYYQWGKPADSVKAYEKAVQLSPASAIALRGLGRALFESLRGREAQGYLEQAAELLPDDAVTLSALHRTYLDMADERNAGIIASRLEGKSPVTGMADPIRDEVRSMGVSSAVASERATLLVSQGRYRDAIPDFHIAAEARPQDPYIQLGLGQAYMYSGVVDKALFHLRNALRLDPDVAEVHLALGQLMLSERKLGEAITHFRRAIALEPENGMAYARLGGALLASGNYRETLTAYQQAESLIDLDAEMKSNIAAAHGIPGNNAEAIRHYEEALLIRPDYAAAHFGIGYVLQVEGKYQEAIPHLTAALQIYPTSEDALTYLALCHQKLGRLSDAIALYKHVLMLNPGSRVAEAVARLEQSRERRKRAGVVEPWIPSRPQFELFAGHLYKYEPKYLGTSHIEDLKATLNEVELTDTERVGRLGDLTQQFLQTGDVGSAISTIESMFAAMARLEGRTATAALHRLRGLTFLREAEFLNCITNHNEDSCIFPLADGGVHIDQGAADRAATSYAEYLKLVPDDLGARWLFNITYMMRGLYPDEVPASVLIPQQPSVEGAGIKRFKDIAPRLGMAPFDLCGGVVIDDLDGDDRLDIVTSSYDPSGPLHFYHNKGDGSFDDRSSVSRLDDQLGGLNLNGADYDNDGDVDLLILRGAWMYDAGKLRNSLLRNDGNGVFTDVTFHAGLAFPSYPTQAAAWADFDNDGDLDLYIGNESRIEFDDAAANFPSQLFINQGDGTFTERAAEAGVTNDRYAKGVAAGDFDDDGDVDIYVSNNGGNRLFRNNGDLTFSDVAGDLGVTEPAGRSFATWFFDYNNDGHLDLFVGAYDGTITDLALDYLGKPFSANIPRLYRNRGDGTFEDVAAEAGLDHVYLPMGANFGDLDNDGYLDIYLSTGDPSYETLTPNAMLRNDGGENFQDVTIAGGFGHAQKGHGVAFADLDRDGDQDIYNQLGGFYPGDKFSNVLFENPGHGGHFLVLRIEGTKSNRSGFGARISVELDTADGVRTIHRAVGSVSSFGGSPHRQAIGLGNADAIRAIRIDWPASGITQTITDVPLDSYVVVVEGKEGFEVLPYEATPFATCEHAGHTHH
jgi:tetratricopeptide (TPR) repeat protein